MRRINRHYGEIICASVFAICIVILTFPSTRTLFIQSTDMHPYISGFIKFMGLATMGDLIGERILKGSWTVNASTVAKAMIWGILGMAIVLAFSVFNGGVISAQEMGKLPGEGSIFITAFLTSVTLNLIFAPVMFLFHKYMDTLIDTVAINGVNGVTIKGLTDKIDFNNMVSFLMLKTIPLFWIPCHTIVFMLPPEYRIIVSAFLSIALGILLAMNKKKDKESKLGDEINV